MSEYKIRAMSLESTTDADKLYVWVHRPYKYVREYHNVTPASAVRVFIAIMKLTEANETQHPSEPIVARAALDAAKGDE